MALRASEPNAVLGALALVDGSHELESNDRGSFWWTRSHFVLQKVADAEHADLRLLYNGAYGHLTLRNEQGTVIDRIDASYLWKDYRVRIPVPKGEKIHCQVTPIIQLRSDTRELGVAIRKPKRKRGNTLEKQVAFLHLIRCGGTSLRNLIADAVRPRSMLLIHADEAAYVDDQTLTDCDFIVGHFGFGLFERLRHPSWKITMLRDPVDRVISTYFYMKHGDVHESIGKLARELPLEDFIRSDHPVVTQTCENAMTWQIFVDYNLHHRALFRDISEWTLLGTAKRNLGRFDVVGFFEEYEESCRRILRRIGRSGAAETASIPHDNRGICRDDAKVSEQAKELIRERNHLDIALYEWARAHLA